MEYIGALLLFLLPGALAALVHTHCTKREAFPHWLVLWIVYALVIDLLLSLLRLLHGTGSRGLVESFVSASSFFKYGMAAVAMAVALPLAFVWLNRFLARHPIKWKWKPPIVFTSDIDATTHTQEGSPSRNAPLHQVLGVGVLFVGGVVLGVALLMGVYALPSGRVVENVKSSAVLIEAEGAYPTFVDGYKSTLLDSWSDSIMLLMAARVPKEGLLQESMLSYYMRYSQGAIKPREGLLLWSKGERLDEIVDLSYARYWHGYLVVLKPLLTFLNYYQIRVVNTVASTMMFLLLLVLMWCKGLSRYLVPALVMIAFLTPPYLFWCLQYAPSLHVMLIASLALLLGFRWLKRKQAFHLFFMATGMAAAYFDILSYPIASLAIPLLFFALMDPSKNWKVSLRDSLVLSVFWAIGYGGMWSAKWVLATVFTGKDIIQDAMNNILNRTSTVWLGVKFTKLQAVLKNLQMLMHWPYLLAFCAPLLVYLAAIMKKRTALDNGKLVIEWDTTRFLNVLVPFGFVALLAPAWYLLTSNHCYANASFTHRALAGTAFALLSMFARFAIRDRAAAVGKAEDERRAVPE